jgi:hypothetical protein
MARKSWPQIAGMNEDFQLRQEEKWSEYDKHRVIMWDDNTSLPMFKPSGARTQRPTFSAYYAKGSVFIQPCGWMGTGELWEGGVSDSEYMLKSGILEEQKLTWNKTSTQTSHGQ